MFEAQEFISNIVNSDKEPVLEFGGIYTAKIVELKESGVMVTLYDSMKPALLHNSQLDQRKVVVSLIKFIFNCYILFPISIKSLSYFQHIFCIEKY